jgi:hypothetical protein
MSSELPPKLISFFTDFKSKQSCKHGRVFAFLTEHQRNSENTQVFSTSTLITNDSTHSKSLFPFWNKIVTPALLPQSLASKLAITNNAVLLVAHRFFSIEHVIEF